jgi:hypothetical protein
VFVDRELTGLADKAAPEALRKSIEPGLKALATLANEYAENAASRDKSLDGSEARTTASPSSEKIWDLFESWDTEWEGRLARTVTELERAPSPDGDALKERAEDIIAQLRWMSSAIALRRTLDVNTDDKLARAQSPRRSVVREVSAVPARH